MKKHIIVIGGGMAGCAAAYSLRKQGYAVTIIEKDDRLGGRMNSERMSGHTVEMGAVFLTNFYTNVLAFLRETGLDKDLQEQKSESFIVRNGVPLSSKRWSTYLGGAWLSFGAKLRLIKEVMMLFPVWSRLSLHRMWRADSFDRESVAERFSGRYGRELLEYLLEPVLSGYMYWSPERTSQAFQMILLKAALTQRHTYRLKNGLRQIPERAAKGCELLLSHTVTQVKHRKDGGGYTVVVTGPKGERTLSADGIVCATTASVVSRIVSGLTPKQTDFFSSITYSSTVVAAYRIEQPRPIANYATAYPRAEGQPIAAMEVSPDTSTKTGTVKVYASNATATTTGKKSDEAIHAVLTAALSPDLIAAMKHKQRHLHYWQEALPEFDVGHIHKLRAFAGGEIEIADSKMVFAGDYIGGPFVEGAFTSGIEAAERLAGKF